MKRQGMGIFMKVDLLQEARLGRWNSSIIDCAQSLILR